MLIKERWIKCVRFTAKIICLRPKCFLFHKKPSHLLIEPFIQILNSNKGFHKAFTFRKNSFDYGSKNLFSTEEKLR